jgi:hypothetical protein
MNTYNARRRMKRQNIRLADQRVKANGIRFGVSLLSVLLTQLSPKRGRKILDLRAKDFLESLAVALLKRL